MQIRIGIGMNKYRNINLGEIILDGDEYWHEYNKPHHWAPVSRQLIGTPRFKYQCEMRRIISTSYLEFNKQLNKFVETI